MAAQFAYDATVLIQPNQLNISIGCIVGPSDIAPADVPSPAANGSYDWLMYDRIFALSAGSSRVDSTAAVVLRTANWDVKSQRQFQEQLDTVWFVWEASTAISSVQIASSLLLKLH